MDFVTHLPRSVRGHDSIWVIVDRLTKCAYFLSINQKMSMDKLAVYMSEKWSDYMECLRVLCRIETQGSHRDFGNHCRMPWVPS